MIKKLIFLSLTSKVSHRIVIMILTHFETNVSTLSQSHMTTSVKLFFICVFPGTSLLWWTTEEECLAMAHTYCIRYANHTEQIQHLVFFRWTYHDNWSFVDKQGLQRRITVTIVHESGGELEWKDIRELVVGKLRSIASSVILPLYVYELF